MTTSHDEFGPNFESPADPAHASMFEKPGASNAGIGRKAESPRDRGAGARSHEADASDTTDAACAEEKGGEEEIEVTPEMIQVVDGISVNENDFSSERAVAYAQIFSNMLMTSVSTHAQAIRRVVFKGVPLGWRTETSDEPSNTERTVETAETRIRDLQSALVKYGHHIPECDYLQDTLPCTCGFEALRSGLRQEGEHDAVLVEPDAACASWRCFHCDEVFTDRSAALEHFGESECHTPGCQIDITDVRAMEKALRQYRAGDTLLYRQLRQLKSDHATALRREEEKGYARGVADMREQLTAAIAALRDLVDYTDPKKDVSLASAGARVERARALLERLGAM